MPGFRGRFWAKAGPENGNRTPETALFSGAPAPRTPQQKTMLNYSLGKASLEYNIERFHLDTVKVAEVVPPSACCQSGDQSVDHSHAHPNFPRARVARFRPSIARSGGFPGPAWGPKPTIRNVALLGD